MDPQKLFKQLEQVQDNLYSVLDILDSIKIEASTYRGSIGELLPVNIQAVHDSIENLASGEGQGTINGLMDLLLGASASDFISPKRNSTKASEVDNRLQDAPDLSNGPKSSIVSESIERFYKKNKKAPIKESHLSWDAIVEDDAFGLDDDYDNDDYFDDVTDTLQDFGIDMSEDLIEDDENYYDNQDDYDGPSWNGDFNDFADDLFPEDLSIQEMKTRMEHDTGPVGGQPVKRSALEVAKSFGSSDDIPDLDDFSDEDF